MSCYGESDIGTSAGERVDRRVNGAGLTLGLLQGQEPVGVDGFRGIFTGVDERDQTPSRR